MFASTFGFEVNDPYLTRERNPNTSCLPFLFKNERGLLLLCAASMLCDSKVFSVQLYVLCCRSTREGLLNGSLFYTYRFSSFSVFCGELLFSRMNERRCRITERPLYTEHSRRLVLVLIHHSYCIPVHDTCETCLKPRYLFFMCSCLHAFQRFF